MCLQKVDFRQSKGGERQCRDYDAVFVVYLKGQTVSELTCIPLDRNMKVGAVV